MVAGHTRDEIALFPSPVLLPTVIPACQGSNVAVGAQNIHFAEEGAYTAKPRSASSWRWAERIRLSATRSEAVLRRTDKIVNKKLHTALKHGVVPIVCVGEVLEERESGKTAGVLETQITGAAPASPPRLPRPSLIAYEPVWAIGTGGTATPETAVDAHRIIRAEVAKLLGVEV